MINVLWIDDEASIVESAIASAEQEDICLIHKLNWAEAKEELKDNKDKIEAVIFDCYCAMERGESANDEFLINAISELKDIYGKKNIPWYVYSGGTKNGNTPVEKQVIKNRDWDKSWPFRYYTKSKTLSFDDCVHCTLSEDGMIINKYGEVIGKDGESHFKTMLCRLKRAVEETPERKIRVRFSDIFEILERENYCFKENVYGNMLTLLKAVYLNEEPENPDNYYNSIRQIFENIFLIFKDFGIIPNDIYFNARRPTDINFANCKKFLLYDCLDEIERKGIKKKYVDNIFSQTIAKELICFVNICNDFSHIKSDRDRGFANKYALFSCVMALCEALRQMDDYLRKNPNKEENEKKVISI